MSHIFSTKKPKSAIDMSRYGIGVVVLTEHEGMDKLVFDFEHKPDQVWCGGKGKKYFHQMLHKQLIKEDKYFDNNPKLIERNSERWTNFMDDCVIYATLNAYLYKEPIYLIHPQCYEELKANAPFNASSGELPTVIEDISVLQ
jgi:hypothetical protein